MFKDTQSLFAIQGYLKDIGRYSILTKEEEITLFEQLKAGDTSARDKIISANLRLVIRLARHFEGRGVSLEDLIQEGNIGLMEVISKFDHTLGFRFSTYAAFWIRQAMQVAVRKQATLIRLPVRKMRQLGYMHEATERFQMAHGRVPTAEEIAKEMNVDLEKIEELEKLAWSSFSLDAPIDEEGSTLSDCIQDERAEHPLKASINKEIKAKVSKALDCLSESEHSVLKMRFGLGGGGRQSLRSVSKHIGLSQEGVRRTEQRAISKLRRTHISNTLCGLL